MFDLQYYIFCKPEKCQKKPLIRPEKYPIFNKWFLLSFKVLVLDYWFCFSASFTCKLSCIINILPQICKQTKYKIHTENWFWLCTCTIVGILLHYSQNHWPEWTCQSWGYFVIYKLLVQGSFFVMCKLYLGWFSFWYYFKVWPCVLYKGFKY